MSNAAADLRQEMRHRVSPFVRGFARVGYSAKGVLYITVGVLAAWAAVGNGQSTGSKGALRTLLDQPFGQILVGIVAAGLACYACWQFMRSVEDPEGEGTDGKGVAKRIGFGISGVIHASLVVYALHLLVGAAGADDSGDGGAQSWSATVMSYPAGRIVLGLIGSGIAVFGLHQLYAAYAAKLDDQLSLKPLSASARRTIKGISRFGMAARGIVFGVIGMLLIIAAYQYDPSEARGLGGALQTLREQPFGPWLLGAVALGLVAYGVYEFVLARYRRIDA